MFFFSSCLVHRCKKHSTLVLSTINNRQGGVIEKTKLFYVRTGSSQPNSSLHPQHRLPHHHQQPDRHTRTCEIKVIPCISFGSALQLIVYHGKPHPALNPSSLSSKHGVHDSGKWNAQVHIKLEASSTQRRGDYIACKNRFVMT